MTAVALLRAPTQFFRVLTCADAVAPNRRRREWLEVGCCTAIAGLVLIVEREDHRLWLDAYDQHGTPQAAIPCLPFNFNPLAPYRVIPRALRTDRQGRPLAVLLETQFTGPGEPTWSTSHTALEGHHANPSQHNHPAPGV